MKIDRTFIKIINIINNKILNSILKIFIIINYIIIIL